MFKTKMSDEEITMLYSRHFDMLYRLAFTYMKTKEDSEDAVQAAFIKLIKNPVVFQNEEHQKAWLITVCVNQCKDTLKREYKTEEPLDDFAGETSDKYSFDGIMEEILKLPLRLRSALYLSCILGYSSGEIEKMTGRKASTVRNDLSLAREELKKKTGGDLFE